MITSKKSIQHIDLEKKTVLLRVDYNVPFDSKTKKVLDLTRIMSTIPTINLLLEKNCKIIICSHFGRPKGKYNQKLSLDPISKLLSEILNKNIGFIPYPIDSSVQTRISQMQQKDILMLDNIRFHPEEEDNNENFSKLLASFCDIYVNDAFGASHRSHASISGIAQFVPSVAGLLLEKEIIELSNILHFPKTPFTSILGGAKVSDKIKVVENLLSKSNNILIGGGMAATFLLSQNLEVGKSIVELELTDFCSQIINKTKIDNSNHLCFPQDVVVGQSFEKYTKFRTCLVTEVGPHEMILDIGPKTINLYKSIIRNSATIFWNGPMGIYEWPNFSHGTREIADSIANSSSKTIIGGGSTVDASHHFQIQDKINHISTGGGASLEFLEGKLLPGIKALEDK